MDKILQQLLKDLGLDFEKTTDSIVKPSIKKTFICFFVTLFFALIIQYASLLAMTFRNPEFVMFCIFMLFIFIFLNLIMQQRFVLSSKIAFCLISILGVYLLIGNLSSMEIINANRYQKQLVFQEDADFYSDNETISYDTIPVVDYDSAMRLGDRKMGEMIEYVSQFDVTDAYEQINYNNQPYRVTPLEYSDIIKWFSNKNEGLPGYIMVNMVSQDAEVVTLEQGMKYSQSELFFRNIDRHIRINYPTLQYDEVAFEVDDEGVPYYVAPVFDYQIGFFGGKDIVGAIVVNAINGDHNYYGIADVPSWVDRVYPSDLIETQLTNWGKYTGGYLNSIFGQKGVLQTTNGYNYLAIDGDVYYYTGLTSVSADASNVGFVLVNLRTKEAKYYQIPGAQEESAKASAEGLVQHLGYVATFPILVNAGGVPTYFMSLKDSAGLVKQYAFVSVEDYQIVATGDTVANAQDAYYTLLLNNNKLQESEIITNEVKGTIENIANAVVDGNSYYYITLQGEDALFVVSITQWDRLPILQKGDSISIEFEGSSNDTKLVTNISY